MIKIKPSHEGRLHKAAGKSKGKKFSLAELSKLKKSRSPKVRKEATFAKNAREWKQK